MGDDTIKKNISKNITKYREKRGMSQKELAQKLGVVPSRISNWETGANCPTIDILFDVCEILDVSINDIYGVYPNSKFVLEYDEQDFIKKYRTLDKYGKNNVNQLLENEYSRCKAEAFWEKTQPTLFDLFPSDSIIQDVSSSANDTLVEIPEHTDKMEFIKKMMDFFEQNPFPNAAHARTDIKPTTDDVKHDESE